MKRLFILFSYFSVLIIIASLITVFVWAFYPYKILEFRGDNGTLLQTEVKAGDYLQMQQDFCKYRDLISHIDRQFIDSFVYQVPSSMNRRPLGCHRVIEQIYVPKALPPGIYYLSTTVSFEVNPIRTIKLNVKTANFEVTK